MHDDRSISSNPSSAFDVDGVPAAGAVGSCSGS